MNLNNKNISIIGLGLIGGSMAKALSKIKEKHGFNLYGIDNDDSNFNQAFKEGIVLGGFPSLKSLSENSDIIIIATPISAVKNILKEIIPFIGVDTIITDACSAKKCVINDFLSVAGNLNPNLVPAHPIAGKETSGYGASESSLFIDKRLIITPHKESNMDSVGIVESLWKEIGANVEIMDADKHDETFALTSHLPHLLAYATMETINNNHPDIQNVLHYTGGGFKDFIRIAKSDPTMWSDITMSNREHILKWMKLYQVTLNDMINVIESEDKDALFDIISKSNNNLI